MANAREQANVWERAQRMFLLAADLLWGEEPDPIGACDYFYQPTTEERWLVGRRTGESCYIVDVRPDRQTCSCRYRAEHSTCKHIQALVLQFVRQGAIDLNTPVATVSALLKRHHERVSSYLAATPDSH